MMDTKHDKVLPIVTVLTIAIVGALMVKCAANPEAWIFPEYSRTVLKTITVVLMIYIGFASLGWYFNRRRAVFLYVGAGFLGFTLQDVFYLVTDLTHLNQFAERDMSSSGPESWFYGSVFLGIMMVLAATHTERPEDTDWHSHDNKIHQIEKQVFFATGLFVAAGIFILFYPIQIFAGDNNFNLPFLRSFEEWLPALIFTFALFKLQGHGGWHPNSFKFWLALALMLNVVAHAMVMSNSEGYSDFPFILAHILKIMSYTLVLIGLQISTYKNFRRGYALVGQLTSSEGLLTATLENTQHGYSQIDIDGKFNRVNRAFCDMLGYEREELIGQPAIDIVNLESSELVRRKMAQREHNFRRTYEPVLVRKDGTKIDTIFYATSLRNIKGETIGSFAFTIDVTEQKAKDQELARHREELAIMVAEQTSRLRKKSEQLQASLELEQHYNKQQSQFVSTVSHDFRTPLTIIDSTARRIGLKFDKLNREEVDAKIIDIRGAVTRMTELIDRTLASAKMEESGYKISITNCKLKSIISGIAKRQGLISPSHTIEVDLDSMPDFIEADAGALEQIFTNLISNAVKYSPTAGLVCIAGCQGEGHVLISITDCGVGIPADEIDKMFERFYRASTSEGIVGTGIGLNIAQQLTEQHGGKISLESVVGSGTTFTVCLPITQKNNMAISA